LWGELESEEESSEEEPEEEEGAEGAPADESGLVTPAEGLIHKIWSTYDRVETSKSRSAS